MECKVERESKAAVEGRGMLSERERRRGISSSIASSSYAGAVGERRGNVRLCSWRV